MSVLDRDELDQSSLADLHAIASELGLEGYRRLRREDLIAAILESAAGVEDEAIGTDEAEDGAPPSEPPVLDDEDVVDEERDALPGAPDTGPAPPAAGGPLVEEPVEVPFGRSEAEREPAEEVRAGVLDILPNGSGFMRPEPYVHSEGDVYVSPAQIRRCELRSGDSLSGPVRPPRRSERYPSLVRIESVNGEEPEPPAERPRFEELTPVFASERFAVPDDLAAPPFGKGSRVAVGGPAGSGATTLLRRVLTGLTERHPALEIVVVLAGVRPEEVTEWRRGVDVTVAGGGFDRPVEEQAQVADLAVERGKRVVERGGDAAIVVDSLDALPPGAGRRVFGAARNTEEAGSLTVIAATGTAGELQRVATTRILLERGAGGEPSLSPLSGTVREELLG